jgi:hypothetical protein
MLTLEPAKRPSIADCLNHKWITNREEHLNAQATTMSLSNIKDFKKAHDFQRAIMAFIASHLTAATETEELSQAFR